MGVSQTHYMAQHAFCKMTTIAQLIPVLSLLDRHCEWKNKKNTHENKSEYSQLVLLEILVDLVPDFVSVLLKVQVFP